MGHRIELHADAIHRRVSTCFVAMHGGGFPASEEQRIQQKARPTPIEAGDENGSARQRSLSCEDAGDSCRV